MFMGLTAYVGPPTRPTGARPLSGARQPLADMLRPMRYPELYEDPEAGAPSRAGANFFGDSLEQMPPRRSLSSYRNRRR